MSTSSFSHVSLYSNPPRSSLIKEDLLCSFEKVSVLKKSVSTSKENSNSSVISQMENVCKVYNENVAYITSRLNANPLPPFPEREEYLANDINYKTTVNFPVLHKMYYNQYDIDRANYELRYSKDTEENSQCRQLIPSFQRLRDKILKLNTLISEKTTAFRPIDLAKLPAEQHLFFSPQLRTPKSTTSEQLTSTPIVVVPTALSSKSTNSREVLPSHNATITCDLGDGNVLGICCAPAWAEKPIAFTATEKGWTGQIPTNVDYKFVILKDGRIQKWEQGNNRIFAENSQPLTLASNQVKF